MREREKEKREREKEVERGTDRQRDGQTDRQRQREYITRLELSHISTHKTKAFPGAGAEQRRKGTIVKE